MMAPDEYRLGLTGWPLGHSLSPLLHDAALRAAGLEGEYRLYPVPPGLDGEQAMQELIATIRRGELHGLNVTVPHKQAVIRTLDRLSSPAAAAGAVNTIFLDGGDLVGDNTDIPGFLSGLDELSLSGRHTALVLGAGGASRAVVSGLASTWGKIFIVARRLSQAQQVADELSGIAPQGAAGPGALEIVPLPFTAAAVREASIGCNLIVNTTPVGMVPAPDASPWPDEVPIPATAAVYDLVYNPRETAFIRLARLAGVPAVGGLGMLIEQAALSFERWTGQPASRQAMRAAVSDHRGTL